jgi:hypothetical protein
LETGENYFMVCTAYHVRGWSDGGWNGQGMSWCGEETGYVSWCGEETGLVEFVGKPEGMK